MGVGRELFINENGDREGVQVCMYCKKEYISIIDKSVKPLTVIEETCPHCKETLFLVLSREEVEGSGCMNKILDRKKT